MGFLQRSQSLGLASVMIAVSILLSRFMGLIRDKVISYYHGAGAESDLYFMAFTIPDFVVYLLAGAYFSITLIPLLSRRFQKGDEDGWRFLSAVITWVFILGGLLIVIAFIFAPQLSYLAAPGFSEEQRPRLILFMRLILPAQIFFLIGFCYSARLYQQRQFIAPTLIPLVYNAFIILFGIIWADQGMLGFCYGVMAGALVGSLLLPLIFVLRNEGWRYRPRLRDPDLKKVLLLSLPLMLGQSVVILDEQFLRIFGSLISDGAVSCLSYARRLMLVPIGVVAQAAGVASFPFLARLAAEGDYKRFNQTINNTARVSVFLLIPISIWMIVAAEPTIRLIFEQGRFEGDDTVLTAHLMRILLISLFCWGIHQIIARAFYAHQDTLTPSLIGTAASLLAIPVYYLLTRMFSASGVVIASSLFTALYTLALTLAWRRKHGGEAMAGLPSIIVRSALCCLPAALAALGVIFLCAGLWPASKIIAAAIELALSGAAFSLIFTLAALLLLPETARPLLFKIIRRGGQTSKPSQQNS